MASDDPKTLDGQTRRSARLCVSRSLLVTPPRLILALSLLPPFSPRLLPEPSSSLSVAIIMATGVMTRRAVTVASFAVGVAAAVAAGVAGHSSMTLPSPFSNDIFCKTHSAVNW